MIADDLNVPALAAGVIMLAISDARWQPKRAATSRDGAREQGRRWQDRANARAFLNSDALDCWCAIANLNADRVRAAIRDGLLDRQSKRRNRYPQRRQRAEICTA